MEISITAATLPALFEAAVPTVLELLTDPAEVGEALREKVSLEAADPAALLQAWVNALIGLAKDQGILVRTATFPDFNAGARLRRAPTVDAPTRNACRLRADLVGELIDPLRHPVRNPPAQLICSRTQLKEVPAGFTANLVFGSQQ